MKHAFLIKGRVEHVNDTESVPAPDIVEIGWLYDGKEFKAGPAVKPWRQLLLDDSMQVEAMQIMDKGTISPKIDQVVVDAQVFVLTNQGYKEIQVGQFIVRSRPDANQDSKDSLGPCLVLTFEEAAARLKRLS